MNKIGEKKKFGVTTLRYQINQNGGTSGGDGHNLTLDLQWAYI